MRRALAVVGYGLAGLAVAIGLALGAFALAGQEISEPAAPPVFTPAPTAVPSPADDRPSPSKESETPSPSFDDHGGDADGSDNSGPGGGGEDHSGSGGDEDNSGPGGGDD